MPQLTVKEPFLLESGAVLPNITIAYETYGHLKKTPNNVIWVCHALTANADAADWWSGLIGQGKLLDPTTHFIVCANILGSCYGTTGPADINPATNQAYARNWPIITIRDMVAAHQLLADNLGIEQIHLCIGGSLGGQQAVEWAITQPSRIENLVLLATSAQHSPWGIAWNEAQRLALFADASFWQSNVPDFGRKGITAARAIGMISYRSYEGFQITQTDPNTQKLEDFSAASYQRYQGLKLHKRFHPWSYWSLSRSMDSHNVGRGRGGLSKALKQITAKTLVIGISSDILFPLADQAFLAQNISNAHLEIIESQFGHDGFLIEFEAIGQQIKKWTNAQTSVPTEAMFQIKYL